MLVCLILLIAPVARADTAPSHYPLTRDMEYLQADEGEFDIDTIREPAAAARFVPVGRSRVSLGYTGGRDHWFRFELEGLESARWQVLKFSNPRLGEVTLFYPDAAGHYSARSLGLRRPFWDRQIGGLTPAFPVQLDAGERRSCYVRIRHFGSLRFDAQLWEWGAYNHHAGLAVSLSLLMSGAILSLSVYNLGVFLHLRQRGYLWLALFLAAANANLMAASGTASMLLWPEPSLLSRESMTITSVITLCVGIGLCNYLLRAAPGAAQLSRVTALCGGLAAAGGLASLAGYTAALYVLFLGAVLAPIGVTAMAIVALRAGKRIALGFLACWGLVLLGVLVSSLMGPGYLPATPLTENFIFAAIFVAAIGWSFTLTRQIKVRENEQRDRLERQVAERTAALRSALEEVKTLHGLLPICCSCKKIRDDDGYWQHVETYLQAHTAADFSHGLCPDCAGALYPNYFPRGDSESPDGGAATPPRDSP